MTDLDFALKDSNEKHYLEYVRAELSLRIFICYILELS